jgi:DNA-binding MarR family transcriptional regulator
MGFQEAFIALAKDKDLTGESYRILNYLLGHLTFENHIALPQIAIAKDLDMHKQHVSRAISLLVRKKVIVEGPKLGRTKTYRLNSHYGWRGQVKNLSATRPNDVIPFPTTETDES